MTYDYRHSTYMQGYLRTLAHLTKAKRCDEHIALLGPNFTSKLLLFELEEYTVLLGCN
jgi:hypothetical protein